MAANFPDHYATLGLDRDCTLAQIRAAYRLLAKQHHPDVNPGAPDASARSLELNAAHEILSDPKRRRDYDRELAGDNASSERVTRIERNITQDVHLRIDELFRGTSIEVQVKDPANAFEQETYPLEIPPETAPGTRFRIERSAPFDGGWIAVRVKVRPNARFKVRGGDLQTDLRISAQRATTGGSEAVASPTGGMLRVQVPARVSRGEVIRVAGEGLPKPRGGRGDLLVRITYRPEVRVTRTFHR